MTLGDFIKKYREKHNISMDEFSKMCNLSKGYISMLENNINPRNNKPIAPTLPTIKKIASAMNTDIDSILKVLDSDQEIILNLKPEHPPKIMQYYEMLNDIGKREATKRVEEMTYAPQYSKKDALIAAHSDDDNTEAMLSDVAMLKRLKEKRSDKNGSV